MADAPGEAGGGHVLEDGGGEAGLVHGHLGDPRAHQARAQDTQHLPNTREGTENKSKRDLKKSKSDLAGVLWRAELVLLALGLAVEERDEAAGLARRHQLAEPAEGRGTAGKNKSKTGF